MFIGFGRTITSQTFLFGFDYNLRRNFRIGITNVPVNLGMEYHKGFGFLGELLFGSEIEYNLMELKEFLQFFGITY